MSAPEKVTGQACLDYIDKPIGIASRDLINNQTLDNYSSTNILAIYVSNILNDPILTTHTSFPTRLSKMKHDISKRIIGLVTKKYSDGGYRVILLGNESFNMSSFDVAEVQCDYGMQVRYNHIGVTDQYLYDPDFNPPLYPPYVEDNLAYQSGVYSMVYDHRGAGQDPVGFDDAVGYEAYFKENAYPCSHTWKYQGLDPIDNNITSFTITNDKNNTLVIGQGMETHVLRIDNRLKGDPLTTLCGNLYGLLTDINFDSTALFPGILPDQFSFEHYVGSNAEECSDWNLVTIPYNLILTESESFALAYLSNGTLPPDAFLFPLDWSALPSYQPGDNTNPEDNPNDNTPDDNSRDVDPNLPIVPSYTPSMLSNYNWYWLTVANYSDFISWFWNDIGSFHDFDDIIAKIEGLYNDVASAVLMVRYFPVDISWIGGLGQQSSIKVGMIEKSGAVDTISQASPPSVRDIGHIHISRKYKSFIDLSPYTQLSVYLPFHGFIDLDIDIMMGHDLYVKGIYDYLTGTIQYLLYYDNVMLINSVVAKMAVDIPITLQTKNDRDSAVFNNVANTVGGLIGAGVGLMSGNPIGMSLGVTQGVQALNGANQSAPLNVKGTVGETGALYSPPQCYIMLRRPTIQSSDKGSTLDTWKRNIGQLCGYGYKLQGLKGAGFTVCHTPRINFTQTIPLQSEIDEIYECLEKGVIL